MVAIFRCILKIQAEKISLEVSNPLAKDILPLAIMNKKHSNLMKKIEKLFGLVKVAEING